MSFRARIALVALAGLAIRLAITFGPGRHVKGIGDWYFFHWGANLNADGHWFIDPLEYTFKGRSLASAGHPPLWELVLTPVSWLGGTSYLAHRAVGCVLGAVTVALCGLLGRRIGGDRVGFVAAIVAALYPVFIGADSSLMSESLYGLLIAGALLLAFRLSDGGGAWTAAALGAVIALAALTRSEALLLVLLCAVPLALLGPREGRWLRAGAAVLAAALVLAPWTIRNWAEFGRPVLVSTNDGTLLAGANCHSTYRGRDLGFWDIGCISRRTIDNEAEQAARWRSEGLDYAGGHLGRLPVVVAVRVLRTWDLYQPRRMVLNAEGRWIRIDQAGVAAYYLLLPFALFGGWLIRSRRRELAILLAPVLLVFVQSAVGYGIPRFRMAADLVIVVLAAVAIVSLLERRSSRAAERGRPAALAGG